MPAPAAALAKALTGAYLSSGGNAFSSRTASMIVQQHFPPSPSTVGLESGPLFGVQFSQLPCSDLNARFGAVGPAAMIGPKRSPLGLAADPGGFPLYKNGVLVGGIGVMADGQYSFDPNVLDTDRDTDEAIALAGTVGFEAPDAIRADRIYVDGTQLRYSDASYASLFDNSSATYANTAPALGSLIALTGYYPGGALRAGAAYGTEASGIRPSTAAEFGNRDAFVLSDGAGSDRFAIRGGTDAGDVTQPLSAAEVRALLEQAFAVMSRARAQIRQPLDSRAQVSISVVDTRGQVLGIVRAPDAPLFGIDVSLQKARTATFFSGPHAASDLSADPSADVRAFVAKVRTFLNDPNALTGTYAFADRSGGNLSRPYFPDGQVGNPERTAVAADCAMESFHYRAAVGAGDRQPRPAPWLRHRRQRQRHAAAVHFASRRGGGAEAAAERDPDLPGLGADLPRKCADRRDRRLGRRYRPGRHDQLPRSQQCRRTARRIRQRAGRHSRRQHRRERGRRDGSIAIRQLSLRAVPRQRAAECLPGPVVLAPLLLPLLAQAAAQPAAAPDQQPQQATPQDDQQAPPPVDSGVIEGRRRPGYVAPLPPPVTQDNPGAVRAPPPSAFPTDQVPIPDRWRLIQSLGLVTEHWYDPYNQNTLKGDRPIDRAKVPWLPIKGDDWFFTLSAVSDSVLEPRTFPIPVGVQTTERPQSLDVFGKDASYIASQTFIVGAALTKGSTAFKPPEIEYRLTPGAQFQLRRRARAARARSSSRRSRRTGSTTSWACRKPSSITTSATFRRVTTSIRSASASSRSSPTFAASCSTTSSSACACSAIATTTASSTTWRRSGGSRRTPTAGSTRC